MKPDTVTLATSRDSANQFLRFCIVGVVGFVVDASVLYVLRKLGLGLYAGRFGSYLVAATVTWGLNRRYTFVIADNRPLAVQWLRFLGANAVGGAANYGIYAALVTWVPFVTAWPTLGVAVGAIAGLAFNFTINKFWVFRAHHRAAHTQD